MARLIRVNVHISAVEFPSGVELGRVVDDRVVRSLEAVLKNRHHFSLLSEHHAVGDVGVTTVLRKQQPGALRANKVQVQIGKARVVDPYTNLGGAD